jgi:hypothetical protein
MHLNDIREILNQSSARRPAPGFDVWLLETHPGPWWKLRSSPNIEPIKLAILNAAWQLPRELYLNPEVPLDSELRPFLLDDGPPWRVDKTKSAERFYATEPASGLGNWQLYAGAKYVTDGIPNTFKTDPAALIHFMTEHDIVLVIDVFHDDTDWCVALR